jgi:hypothetical protein
MSLNIKFSQAMFGGANGGVNIASGTTTGVYDFIIVESGVTFTVLTDNLNANLVTGKNLTAVAFASERILSAGTGKTIKALTFTGGLVWGYTLETSTTI